MKVHQPSLAKELSMKKRKRHSPEQIVKKLRDADATLLRGTRPSGALHKRVTTPFPRRHLFRARVLELDLGDIAQEAVGQVLLATGGRSDLQRSSDAIKRIDRFSLLGRTDTFVHNLGPSYFASKD